MSCFATVSPIRAPLIVLRFPLPRAPHAPCGSHAKHHALPHATEQDTLLIASLIRKQVIPYRTRGGTGCSGRSTPKNWSLAYSSGTNHITGRTYLLHHSTPCSNHNIDPLPRSTHILKDGRPQLSH
jgi:hypothetical protein